MINFFYAVYLVDRQGNCSLSWLTSFLSENLARPILARAKRDVIIGGILDDTFRGAVRPEEINEFPIVLFDENPHAGRVTSLASCDAGRDDQRVAHAASLIGHSQAPLGRC